MSNRGRETLRQCLEQFREARVSVEQRRQAIRTRASAVLDTARQKLADLTQLLEPDFLPDTSPEENQRIQKKIAAQEQRMLLLGQRADYDLENLSRELESLTQSFRRRVKATGVNRQHLLDLVNADMEKIQLWMSGMSFYTRGALHRLRMAGKFPPVSPHLVHITPFSCDGLISVLIES